MNATHLSFFLLTESIRLDVAIAIGICSALKPSTSSVAPAQASTIEHSSFNRISQAFQNVSITPCL